MALACLSELAASADQLHRSLSRFSYQVRTPGRDGENGRAYERMLSLERRMEMVEDISSAVKTLVRDGHRFRRAQARALYEEGLTMAQLAVVFGVSRQRVSALLRDADGTGPDAGTAQGDGA